MQQYNPKKDPEQQEANAKILIYGMAGIITLYTLGYLAQKYEKQIQQQVKMVEGELEKLLRK